MTTTSNHDVAQGTDRAAALRVEGVSKSFGGTHAVQDVGFSVEQGAVHALLGGNGSGKSTLIKILAGVYNADGGTIQVSTDAPVRAAHVTPEWSRSAGLHFVHQAIGSFPDMSVAENLAIGAGYDTRALAPVRWREVRRRAKEALDRYEIDIDPGASMGALGQARRTMVAVVRALQREERAGRGVLILDEPTASLPAHEVEMVLDTIRGYVRRGHTVMFVTHRLDEVLAIATHATFLRDGRHLETRELAGLDERSLVERIAGVDHLAVSTSRSHGATTVGEPCLELRGVSAGPLNDVNLVVRRGEIVGLSGLLGSGRSSMLRAVFGVAPARAGSVVLDGTALKLKSAADGVAAGIAYIPEDRSADAVFAERPLRENFSAAGLLRYWRRGRIARKAEGEDARAAIDRYGVKTASAEAAISSLSGGNQQKVVLARWIECRPRVLLLDEPTQGVDVGARAAIHDIVRAAAADGVAVVCVSSDQNELAELCHRVIAVRKGQVCGEVSGEKLTPRRCLELAYGISEAEHREKEFA